MPLFLHFMCRGVTELIDICLTLWRPTQSHVRPHAMFLAHRVLDLEVCIFTLNSVFSQCMTHMNREDEYIMQQLLAANLCVSDCQLLPVSLCTTESHVSVIRVDCPMVSVKMESLPSVVLF